MAVIGRGRFKGRGLRAEVGYAHLRRHRHFAALHAARSVARRRGDRPARCPPFVRGATGLGAATSGWDVRQEHRHPDVNVTNRAILDDLAGGVTSLVLRLDRAARDGFDPDDVAAGKLAGRDGLMAYSVDDLDAVLKNVQLQMIGVALDAGAAFIPVAAQFVALCGGGRFPSSKLAGRSTPTPSRCWPATVNSRRRRKRRRR